MVMTRNARISLQSFLFGLGILSYMLLVLWEIWKPLPPGFLWLREHAWAYPLGFFIIFSVILRIIYSDAEYMVSPIYIAPLSCMLLHEFSFIY